MTATGGRTILSPTEAMLRFVPESSQELFSSPRLGKLLSSGRALTETPHYAASTSRGVVPHLAQDVLQRHTNIRVVYMGLEDFVEKSAQTAPIFKTITSSGESALRKYTALPAQCVSILGARRVPRIPCLAQNTNSSISISTSVGFRTLDAEDYNDAMARLRPDASTSLVDLVTADKISRKRIEKSADRTHAWLQDTVSVREEQGQTMSMLFASIPPLEPEQQQLYLSDIADEYASFLSGLAIYTPETAAILPQTLSTLPRLCVSDEVSPQMLLRAIALGVDLITTPLVTAASEQGQAFSFTFPPPTSTSTGPQPLAVDMWSPSHATSLASLTENCTCYTCASHHRAYVHHLLQAKEMLAWTLLQIHNFHMLDRFFAGVRQSIKANTFGEDVRRFDTQYEDHVMPGEGKDRGPRLRGYQMKSAGGDPKRNEKKWGRFEKCDASVTTAGLEETAMQEADSDGQADADAAELERLGLAEKAKFVEKTL